MGDRDGRKDTDAEASPSNGWHFRGQRVVRATLRDLVATQGLAAGDTLVFGGCSAGGWGATAHCDWVKDFVPEGVKISCLIDSPLWLLDVDSTADGGHDPMSNEEATMDEFFTKLIPYANVNGLMKPACLVARPEAEQWKCLFPQYSLLELTTPFFLNTNRKTHDHC